MRIILSFVISFIALSCFSQSRLSTKSKKAAEFYYQADNYRVRGQYSIAIDLLEKAINKDDKFQEAYFILGAIYKAKGDLKSAENVLSKAYELNKNYSGVLYELGDLFLLKGEYAKVASYIDQYLASNPKNKNRITEAKKIKSDAAFALENINDESDFNPHALSDTVNSFPMQYFPVVTVDQKSIIFTRRLGTTMDFDEDLVISKADENGHWGSPQSLSDNINSEWNEGTCTLSADGRTLIFTSCYGRKGYGSCDLYISTKSGKQWSEPKNLGAPINTRAWESQPSLSADGRTLYFVSNRHTGDMGNRDIWVSYLDENEKWSSPENLGPEINTMRNEVSPFIHPNGVTLYFASDGHTGFGGFDIFRSEKLDNNAWSKPKNIGYPINNSEDQVSLFITADGSKGYYSHEEKTTANKKGKIYEFDVPAKSKIKYRTSYIKGKVYDSETKEPLRADIELFNVNKNQQVARVKSDSVNGKYLMVLTEGSEYALYIDKSGYLFNSLSFNYEGKTAEPIEKDIYLKPITKGASGVLNNIFFDLDSYALQEKSTTELKKLSRFLRSNQETKIEIGGHTDNTGSSSYNKDLSLKRAKTVYIYLINEGIPEKQLTYKGYGQTQPEYPNDTKEHRQFNRRIEFKIL